MSLRTPRNGMCSFLPKFIKCPVETCKWLLGQRVLWAFEGRNVQAKLAWNLLGTKFRGLTSVGWKPREEPVSWNGLWSLFAQITDNSAAGDLQVYSLAKSIELISSDCYVNTAITVAFFTIRRQDWNNTDTRHLPAAIVVSAWYGQVDSQFNWELPPIPLENCSMSLLGQY